MNNAARIFNCANCRRQTLICTYCDRGNIYCGLFCARKSRIQNHRIVNHNYQKTFHGKQKHALRQRAYRFRKEQKIKKVTDQGSALISQNDLLPARENDTKKIASEQMHCHFCKKIVSQHCRNDYCRYDTHRQKNNLMRLNDTG